MAAQPSDQPNNVRKSVAQADEIDDLDGAFGSLEHRYQNQRAVEISARDVVGRVGWLNQPPAMFGPPEKRRKASSGIEAR
jgi:hypothetical protein